MDCFASINSASPVTGTFAARAADPAGEIWMLSFDSSSKSRTLCTTASVWISRICSNFGQCLIVAFPWPFSKSWIEIIVYRFHFADFRESQKKKVNQKKLTGLSNASIGHYDYYIIAYVKRRDLLTNFCNDSHWYVYISLGPCSGTLSPGPKPAEVP